VNVLELIQDACRELKQTVPSVVVDNEDKDIQLLLALLTREAKEQRSKYLWPILNKEFVFSTSSSTASYPLPEDFDYECFDTNWDRSNLWALRGPLSAAEWQVRKSGITSSLPRLGFRVKGAGANRLFVEPTPTDTLTLVFEYQSTNWVRPVTLWTASTVFAAGSYCSYNGNTYYSSAGGTSGSTAPVHLTGSASDGVVSWAFVAYEKPLADTDVLVLPADTLTLGLKWRWKRENGFEWESYYEEAAAACRRAIQSGRGAPTIPLVGGRSSALIGRGSIPETGYGS